jgi:hypothetical protein
MPIADYFDSSWLLDVDVNRLPAPLWIRQSPKGEIQAPHIPRRDVRGGY